MALGTYTELQAAVTNWLNRSDLTTRVPEFIELADARVRRLQRWDKRLYSVVTGGDLSITAQGQEVGTNAARPIAVLDLWPTSGTNLLPLRQTSFATLRRLAHTNADATGTPTHYAVVPARDPTTSGKRVRLFLWPRPAGTYTVDLLFVSDVGKLTSPENDLFLFAPDVYLFGALAESAPFLKNDERVAMWEAKFDRALAEINSFSDLAEFSASQTHARLRNVYS